MSIIQVVIAETHGLARVKQFVKVNLPFKKGDFKRGQTLDLVDANTGCHIHSYRVLSYWPNGDVRWVESLLLIDLAANGSIDVAFTSTDYDSPQDISNDSDRLTPFIKPESISLRFTDKDETHLVKFQKEEMAALDDYTLVNKDNIDCRHVLDKYIGTISKYPFITVSLELSSYLSADTKVMNAKMVIHNNNRAIHPNGQWDLGDPNSCLFNSLSFYIPFHNEKITWRTISPDFKSKSSTELETKLNVAGQELSIIQSSSGGLNEFSNVHVDVSNKVPFTSSGYELTSTLGSDSGTRISPLISLSNGDEYVNGFLEHFWQAFPSGVKANCDGLSMDVWPNVGYQHELQPGEKKTFNMWFSKGKNQKAVDPYISPLIITLSPESIALSQTIPFYAGNTDKNIQAIINLGLDNEVGFIAKREAIDEFGWRHFGDLYADHENSEFSGEQAIISHYNNQYDPLYGFLIQYISTGEQQWLVLANELAQHITDIDIYHTELDRAEYNNGLFWHTDHYVDAATGTHRTYSKNQPQNVYMDHAGGGGPGGQHCYTTGLMMHYFLTGCEQSKKAVVALTDWISNVYEGSGGILDFALALKNKDRKDLKNVITGQYPLDRGTGNYIVALLDAFEITSSQSYLDRASLIIKNTVDLAEDLNLRGLDNVEETWFYTVFLQSVCRYIWVKESTEQLDESYYYALNILIKFADWMAENEKPYLETPDILEFPNQTWTAQDLRKVNVLYIASLYQPNNKIYRETADYIYDYIIEHLSQDKTNHYCRILCLLMQNDGVKQYCQSNTRTVQWLKKKRNYREKVHKSVSSLLWQRLVNSSIQKELDWLCQRVDKLNKMFPHRASLK